MMHLRFDNYQGVVDYLNADSENQFNSCINYYTSHNITSYTCLKHFFKDYIVNSSSPNIINGNPVSVNIKVDRLTRSVSPIKTNDLHQKDIGYSPGYLELKCPTNYYLRQQYLSLNTYRADCIRYWDYYLQQSEPTQSDNCEKEGNPCNPITGNKTQTETDLRFEGAYPFVFQRVYSSLGVGTAASSSLGVKWRHSFERNIIYNANYSSVYVVSNGYSSADEACVNSWNYVKNGFFMGGMASTASARKIDDKTCEVYKAGQVLTRFNIIKKLANEPISTTAISPITNLTLSRPDGSHYIFRNENGSFVSLVKGISLVSTGHNTQTFTDSTGTKEFYEDSRLIRIEAVGGLVQTLDYQLTTAQGGDDNNATLDRMSDHL